MCYNADDRSNVHSGKFTRSGEFSKTPVDDDQFSLESEDDEEAKHA